MISRVSPSRRLLAVGVFAASVALVATGCTSGAATPSGAPSAAEFDETATISVGVRLLQSSWDPAKTVGATELPIHKLVYDTLIGLDADLEMKPALAESWETPDGGRTWDFTLRDDAVFSNGDTFDAEDAKASMEHYRADTSTLRSDFATVEAIEVVDPTTLRIVQKQVNFGLPAAFTGRAGLMLSSDVLAAGDITEAIGTGMFEVTQDSPGASVQLAAHDGYWAPENVKVAGASIRLYEDPVAMANAMRSGEIELGIIDPTQVDSITAAGVPNYRQAGTQVVTFMFNPNLAPELADQNVRDALSMAIDREGIAAGLMFGYGDPASQFAFEGRTGYNPDIEPIPYDPELAKEMLADAGLADGFSLTAAVQAANKPIAEAIQAGWAELGVELELTFPPGSGVAEATWTKPSVPTATHNFLPEVDFTAFLNRNFGATSARNPGKLQNEATSALILESAAIEDKDELAAVYDEITASLREHTLTYTPVVWRSQMVAYSDDLVGMQEWQGSYPVLEGVGVAAK